MKHIWRLAWFSKRNSAGKMEARDTHCLVNADVWRHSPVANCWKWINGCRLLNKKGASSTSVSALKLWVTDPRGACDSVGKHWCCKATSCLQELSEIQSLSQIKTNKPKLNEELHHNNKVHMQALGAGGHLGTSEDLFSVSEILCLVLCLGRWEKHHHHGDETQDKQSHYFFLFHS